MIDPVIFSFHIGSFLFALRWYGVLVMTGVGIAAWVAKGGVLVTRGQPNWRELGGSSASAGTPGPARLPGPTAAWLRTEDTAAGAKLAETGVTGVRVFRLGTRSPAVRLKPREREPAACASEFLLRREECRPDCRLCIRRPQ